MLYCCACDLPHWHVNLHGMNFKEKYNYVAKADDDTSVSNIVSIQEQNYRLNNLNHILLSSAPEG